jgi:UDP-N-acetyl-D-mannosaminuronate dehydrogenase
VAVIGLGYVGLPLAAVLANTEGFEVTDIQRRSVRSGWKIAVLNRGDATVNGIEPEVGRMVSEAVEKGTLRASDDFSEESRCGGDNCPDAHR